MSAFVEVEAGDDWGDLTDVTDQRVLEVARAHGTVVAADWSGWSRSRVVELRRRVDGYDRGRGHPSTAEIAQRRPRRDCPCTRCVVWRWETGKRLVQIDAVNSRPTLVDTTADWLDQAACVGQPVDWWFPLDPSKRGEAAGWSHEHFAQAKAICDRCPVAVECGRYATVNRIDDGMWGGLRPVERPGTDAHRISTYRRKAASR